jgi:hypothetical protein
MKTKMAVLTLYVCMCAGAAMAQSPQPRSEPTGVREPPRQAYEDCVGKKAGDTVQHTTPEGKVAATCVESPKGLVARPDRPPGTQSDIRRQPLP